MKDDNLYVSWIVDGFKNNYLSTVNHGELTYFHYLTPFSNPYFGPLNPVLLFCGHSKTTFNDKSHIMLRDGLIPLTYFFKESDPKDFECTFYIPAEFWFLVPKEWRTKVKFFRISAKTIYNAANLPKKIILMGTLNSTFADGDEFAEDIRNLVASLGGKDNLKNIDVAAYFSFKRNDLWGRWDDENILEYSKVLFNEIKMDIKFPQLDNIMSESGFKDVLYHEVNRGYFISQSYMSQHLLSRGAGQIGNLEVSDKLVAEKSISLSLHHTLETFTYSKEALLGSDYVDPFKDSVYFSYRKFFETVMKTHQGNQWDGWFSSYLKSHYKGRKIKSF